MAQAAETPEAPPVRTALTVLQADQRALYTDTDLERYDSEYHLRGGFPSRRAVIEWFQRAIVRTFGHVGDPAPVASLAEADVLMSCFVVGEERDRLRAEPLSLEKARLVREEFEAHVLRPACNRAYVDLRDIAGEHLGEDDAPGYQDLDPEAQSHLAMRPAFQWIDTEQRAALRRLWGGFEDREALFDWLHDLDVPSNGAIRDDITALVQRTDVGTELLLSDHPEPEQARTVREDFAICLLLPAFVEGVDEMHATELALPTSDGLEPITP